MGGETVQRVLVRWCETVEPVTLARASAHFDRGTVAAGEGQSASGREDNGASCARAVPYASVATTATVTHPLAAAGPTHFTYRAVPAPLPVTASWTSGATAPAPVPRVGGWSAAARSWPVLAGPAGCSPGDVRAQCRPSLPTAAVDGDRPSSMAIGEPDHRK